MANRGITVLGIAAVLALLLVTGCGRPASETHFVKAADAHDGVYVFDFELDDSLATYDFSFYGRAVEEDICNVPLKVLWLSPSGESFSETVYMKTISLEGSREEYRTAVIPAEYGRWRMSVRPVVPEGGIFGLGLICSRNDGTR